MRSRLFEREKVTWCRKYCKCGKNSGRRCYVSFHTFINNFTVRDQNTFHSLINRIFSKCVESRPWKRGEIWKSFRNWRHTRELKTVEDNTTATRSTCVFRLGPLVSDFRAPRKYHGTMGGPFRDVCEKRVLAVPFYYSYRNYPSSSSTIIEMIVLSTAQKQTKQGRFFQSSSLVSWQSQWLNDNTKNDEAGRRRIA